MHSFSYSLCGLRSFFLPNFIRYAICTVMPSAKFIRYTGCTAVLPCRHPFLFCFRFRFIYSCIFQYWSFPFSVWPKIRYLKYMKFQRQNTMDNSAFSCNLACQPDNTGRSGNSAYQPDIPDSLAIQRVSRTIPDCLTA